MSIGLASKAIHFNLVSDLTTKAFRAALKRLFSLRDKSSSLAFDNATNFVDANRKLKDLHELFQSQEYNEQEKQRVMWTFIQPSTPHFSGPWEAGVKSFKHHLSCDVGDTLLSFEQLQTYITESEAIFDSRLLSPLSSDPNVLRPLTPDLLLIGESLTSFP